MPYYQIGHNRVTGVKNIIFTENATTADYMM